MGQRAVRGRVGRHVAAGVAVAGGDAAGVREPVERRLVGVVVALAVRDRHPQRAAGLDAARERRGVVGRHQVVVLAADL